MSNFVEMSIFSGDLEAIDAGCTKLHRKQIRTLVKSGALSGHTVATLSERTGDLDYTLPVKGGKIVVPPGGKGLTELLRFLSNKIYRGPIDGATMVATSARKRTR